MVVDCCGRLWMVVDCCGLLFIDIDGGVPLWMVMGGFGR